MHESANQSPARTGGARPENALRALLCGWALTLPVSIALTQAFAYPAALLALFLWVRARDRAPLRSPLFWPAVLFAGLSVLASALGEEPVWSLWRVRRLVVLLPLVFSASLAAGREPPGRFAVRLGACFLAGCALQAGYDAIRIPLLARRGEWLFGLGTMRDPQLYMTGLFVLFAAWRHPGPRRSRVLLAAATLLCAVGLVLHFKRGVWLSFAATLPLLCLACRRIRPLAVFAAAAALALLLPASRERLGRLRDEFSSYEGGRMTLWTEVAPVLIRRHPTGIGVAGSRNEMFRRIAPRVEPGLDHLHNNALQVLLETGWAGLLAWLAWMIAAIRLMAGNVRRHPDPASPAGMASIAALGAFLALMLNGLVEYNFGDNEIFMVFCLLMGAAESIRAAGPGTERTG